jgi:hypothetical protein
LKFVERCTKGDTKPHECCPKRATLIAEKVDTAGRHVRQIVEKLTEWAVTFGRSNCARGIARPSSNESESAGLRFAIGGTNNARR